MFAPVNFFLLPLQIKQVYRLEGRDSPVSGLTGFWFLLPLLGWIVGLVKVQGALNRFWESKGARAG